MTIRKMCDGCTLTDTYNSTDNTCHTCGHVGLQPSENFEDAYSINHLNKEVRAELIDLLANIDAEIEKFEKGWFDTWNAEGPTQLGWETPEDYSSWLKVFKDDY